MNDKTKQILNEIDNLIKDSRLSEAEVYMNEVLVGALSNDEWDIALTVLNEQAGFYRDISAFDKAIDACKKSEDLLNDKGSGDSHAKAAAYINFANVYRASKHLDEAFLYFDRAYELISVLDDPYLESNYYNNLSLLYQEKNDYENSVACLKKALHIADEIMHDEIKTAISRTNLANSLVRLGKIQEAYTTLAPALEIYVGRTPSDFHYSAALAAYADIMALQGKIKDAVWFYEMAKSEIDLHMGHNVFYEMVSENVNKISSNNSINNSFTGLELSRKYYEAFGKPVLEKNFAYLWEHIAVGMAGEGSECLGFDDENSVDHDFGPGFVIWVDAEVSEEDIVKLQRAYSLLPREFMGLKRLETKEGAGRVGVIRISDFLKKATGFDHFPQGITEWQETVDENLILFVNGVVFEDRADIISTLRYRLEKEQPYYVYFMKLAVTLEKMAKYGQYSYARAVKRGDKVAAFMAKAEFIKAAMQAMHIIAHKYAPYQKWLRKSLDSIREFQEASKLIDLLTESVEERENQELIEKICKAIKQSIEKRGLAFCEDNYLLRVADEIKVLAAKTVIADEIVDYEWRAFDKTQNAGGRANCQDDWDTFSVMRRSQYYCFPYEMLKILYADYLEAAKQGRNVITEKYGYMMESTYPEEYERIKDTLPMIDDDKIRIVDSIVAIQVNMMEEFSKEYPILATRSRVIHSYEDTQFSTSYETYLRGELKTYHPDTLIEYGRFIAELANSGDNIAKKCMNMTAFLYGYNSLESAQI
ncbi:MAG: DUF4125 family protein [Lachnospiraceae bacterium]|nr:DUF4125 family protein [Candidatus Merdinaster equi]